ncbi:MAG: hypothetical protein IPQ07_17555 [Myxococcales bacterium]|nr:hypothetical protein [Myxococcales bacterium]
MPRWIASTEARMFLTAPRRAQAKSPAGEAFAELDKRHYHQRIRLMIEFRLAGTSAAPGVMSPRRR